MTWLFIALALAPIVESQTPCTEAWEHCMAHATTEKERRACRDEYIACARRIEHE